MTNRNEVNEAMNNYIETNFRNKTTVFSVTADSANLYIDISCHNLNFKNYWGGEWLSHWTINYTNMGIKGNIKVHNHYFE